VLLHIYIISVISLITGEKNALVSGRSIRNYEVSNMGKSLVIPLIFRDITLN
jgi:hypothetical protein